MNGRVNKPESQGAKVAFRQPSAFDGLSWRERRQLRTDALSLPHKCLECDKVATRCFKHHYHYCEKHWIKGGLILAGQKEWKRAQFGPEIAQAKADRERDEKRLLVSRQYGRNLKRKGYR